MTDLTASERRLLAALDRLDFVVERTARRLSEAPATIRFAPEHAAGAEPPPLSDEISALHDRQAATLEALQMRLAEAHERLAGAGAEAARLASANDQLAAANRALMVAAGGTAEDRAGQGDAIRQALEAEIESLRAARAAEIAQMSEILDELDRMLGKAPPPRPRAALRRQPHADGDGALAAGGAVPPPHGGRDAGPGAGRGPVPGTAAQADLLPEEIPEERSLFGGDYDDDARDLPDADEDADEALAQGAAADDRAETNEDAGEEERR